MSKFGFLEYFFPRSSGPSNLAILSNIFSRSSRPIITFISIFLQGCPESLWVMFHIKKLSTKTRLLLGIFSNFQKTPKRKFVNCIVFSSKKTKKEKRPTKEKWRRKISTYSNYICIWRIICHGMPKENMKSKTETKQKHFFFFTFFGNYFVW